MHALSALHLHAGDGHDAPKSDLLSVRTIPAISAVKASMDAAELMVKRRPISSLSNVNLFVTRA